MQMGDRCSRLAEGMTVVLGALLVAAPAGAQPASSYFGFWGREGGSPITIHTRGSGFDTELGVWNEQGQIVATNDDIGPGELESEIVLAGLPAGRYYAACAGFNASFGDNFFVMPGTATGFPRIEINNGGLGRSLVSFTNGPGPLWVSFDIVGDAPPIRRNFGEVTRTGEPIVVVTADTGFVTETAIWDASGDIVAESDPVGLASRLEVNGLPAGEYYLVVHEALGAANDGFMLTPGFAPSGGGTELWQFGQHITNVLNASGQDDGFGVYRFVIREACGVTCPEPGAIPEGEPDIDRFTTDDTFNGGCSVASGGFGYTVLGQSRCGEAGAAENTTAGPFPYRRDLDWYEFILPQRTSVNLDFAPDFLGYLNLYDFRSADPCAVPLVRLESLEPVGCETASISRTLEPGRYAMLVASDPGETMVTSPYHFSLSGTPADVDDLGVVALEAVPFEITTSGSDFDTEIALYDASGSVLAENDDVGGGNLTSLLQGVTLAPGTYYVAVAGYNVAFSDGFGIDVRAGGAPTRSGLASIRVGSSQTITGVDADRAAWLRFEVGPQIACNAADVATPYGQLDIDDVLFFLGSFAAGDIAADLAPPLGVFDIDDVLLFLSAFASGCP